MTMTMYALKDRLNDYSYPIPFVSKEMAERYWKDTCLTNETIQNNPGDFTFECVGTWDSEAGKVLTYEKHIIKPILKGEN